MSKFNRKRLGDILVELGVISSADLQKAFVYQREKGVRIGRALTELNLITEDRLLETLAVQQGIQRVALSSYHIDLELLKTIPEDVIRKHKLIPLERTDKVLLVAVSDPINRDITDALRNQTGLTVKRVLVSETEVDKVISETLDKVKILEGLSYIAPEDEEETTLKVGNITSVDNNNAVMKLVDDILETGVRERASDIHLRVNKDNSIIRFRVDGVLQDLLGLELSRRFHQVITSRIKVLAKMDISKTHVTQDGRINQAEICGRMIDLRVSSLPSVYGENIVIRILDKSNLKLNLADIGFSESSLNRFNNVIRKTTGMVLVTGPTGSGKTSTLYAVLQNLSDSTKNIITVEDPVEYILDDLVQVQVNQKADLTFANALRTILRQDPDVVFVGEIRDAETAKVAIEASITGHLVLSTLHTNDAVSTVTRLLEIGVDPYLVANSLTGVLHQRLVLRLCDHCKRPHPITPEHEDWGIVRGSTILNTVSMTELTFFKPVGCDRCRNIGYRGRIPVQELLTFNTEMRELISRGSFTLHSLHELAVREGMVPVRDDGLSKALAGLTSLEEVKKIIN